MLEKKTWCALIPFGNSSNRISTTGLKYNLSESLIINLFIICLYKFTLIFFFCFFVFLKSFFRQRLHEIWWFDKHVKYIQWSVRSYDNNWCLAHLVNGYRTIHGSYWNLTKFTLNALSIWLFFLVKYRFCDNFYLLYHRCFLFLIFIIHIIKFQHGFVINFNYFVFFNFFANFLAKIYYLKKFPIDPWY